MLQISLIILMGLKLHAANYIFDYSTIAWRVDLHIRTTSSERRKQDKTNTLSEVTNGLVRW